MQKNFFIAGHKGMVGSAVVRVLNLKGAKNILTATKEELNLTDNVAVENFFSKNKIDVVINAAAKVGGILANDTYPYDFLMQNLQIQNNLIEASVKNKIDKFIFLGSSCIYPKHSPQPIKEEYLLTSSLEPTNQWYALAKIAGVFACQAAKKQFDLNAVSLMPTNLYGPNDNFDLNTSHVLPAMIRKFHEAKEKNLPVILWGSGTPHREFLHVDDLASAIIFALENNLSDDIYNVGYGLDITIKDLAEKIQKIVGYQGEIEWDVTKPDGTPKKLIDSSKIREIGWRPTIDLDQGILSTYNWFLNNKKND